MNKYWICMALHWYRYSLIPIFVFINSAIIQLRIYDNKCLNWSNRRMQHEEWRMKPRIGFVTQYRSSFSNWLVDPPFVNLTDTSGWHTRKTDLTVVHVLWRKGYPQDVEINVCTCCALDVVLYTRTPFWKTKVLGRGGKD